MSGSNACRLAILGLVGWLGSSGTNLLGQEEGRDSRPFLFAAEQDGKPDPNQFRVLLEQNPHVDLLATDTGIGVSLVPVDATLRSHLNLPEGQGLVVASVTPDSPAAKAGIEPKDILTKAGDHVLSAAADLENALQGSGEQPIRIQGIRAGKPREFDVKAVNRLTFVLREMAEKPYWLGVQVSPADETLRAQLQLPDGQGLVITAILPNSPAIAAGLKANDILLTISEKPISSSEDLVARVQDAKDQPISIGILRAGKPMKIGVTPQKRWAAVHAAPEVSLVPKTDYVLRFVHPQVLTGPQRADLMLGTRQVQEHAVAVPTQLFNENGKTMEKKLNELIEEVKKLHKEISKIEASLEPEGRPEGDSKRP